MAGLFPVMLKLEEKTCLVVGGGLVSERKTAALLQCGARVTLVSPCVTAGLQEMAKNGLIELHLRMFLEEDLLGKFLVIGATSDPEINQTIAARSSRLGILVNIADAPELCGFYLPAVVRRGSLQISVSTDGKVPLLARRLREELSARYGPEYGVYTDLLGEVRKTLASQVPDARLRRQLLAKLLDSDLLELIKSGDEKRVKERIAECISSW